MFHRCRRKLLLGSCELCNQVLNNGLQFALFESFVPSMHQIFNIAIIFVDYQTTLLHHPTRKFYVVISSALDNSLPLTLSLYPKL